MKNYLNYIIQIEYYMPIISDIETAILGLLCEGFRYGYQLEKTIQERGMRRWTDIGFSSIYYVLKRLERKELIVSAREEVEGKPSRRVYTVTEEGRQVMKETLVELLSEHNKLISPFDLGVAYLHQLGREEVVESLEGYLESLDRRIAFLEDSITSYRKNGAAFHVIALFQRPLQLERAERAWTEEFIRTVKENMEETEV